MLANSKPDMQAPPRAVSASNTSQGLAGANDPRRFILKLDRLQGDFFSVGRGDGHHDSVDDPPRKTHRTIHRGNHFGPGPGGEVEATMAWAPFGVGRIEVPYHLRGGLDGPDPDRLWGLEETGNQRENNPHGQSVWHTSDTRSRGRAFPGQCVEETGCGHLPRWGLGEAAMLWGAVDSSADFACRLVDAALGPETSGKVALRHQGDSRRELRKPRTKEHGHGRHYYPPATR